MPAPNLQRRDALTDAAIRVAADAGIGGLTHRAVHRVAGVPAGTASNYFPSRRSLLVATAERMVALQEQDFVAAVDAARTLTAAAEAITDALVTAATHDRARWTALFEFQAEARRDENLVAAFAPLQRRAEDQTADWHRTRGVPIDPAHVPVLQALFGGALQALLALPKATVSAEVARPYARAMLLGIRRAG